MSEEQTVKIIVWPNGMWQNYEDHVWDAAMTPAATAESDDFKVIHAPANFDDESIDILVDRLYRYSRLT